MKREPEAVLGVCGLHIRRGRTTILHSVSWSVERGQHWVILGANGSGKTSLLSALTGYLTPDRKSTRLNSSHSQISYAVFCLKKKRNPPPAPPPSWHAAARRRT